MAKYLKVGITRLVGTELYIEVPDDFEPSEIMNREHFKELARIASETASDSDWDNEEPLEETIEVCSVGVVSKAESDQYATGTLKE